MARILLPRESNGELLTLNAKTRLLARTKGELRHRTVSVRRRRTLRVNVDAVPKQSESAGASDRADLAEEHK